ncbi:MAG: hypothetical protein AAGK01_08175 [Pseudomonadota bacterium]
MLKLYSFHGETKRYWETWETSTGESLVHWGSLGTRGETKTVKSGLFRSAQKTIQKEIDGLAMDGFAPVELDEHAVLLIEYPIDEMGTVADLEKRHRLEDRMNETLGWTGLGMCDGGSSGSGTMEVCCFVVDFEVAKQVISEDLEDTEFRDYARIYRED